MKLNKDFKELFADSRPSRNALLLTVSESGEGGGAGPHEIPTVEMQANRVELDGEWWDAGGRLMLPVSSPLVFRARKNKPSSYLWFAVKPPFNSFIGDTPPGGLSNVPGE